MEKKHKFYIKSNICSCFELNVMKTKVEPGAMRPHTAQNNFVVLDAQFIYNFVTKTIVLTL